MSQAEDDEPVDLEGGKRLRAAFAYAGLSKAERAAALGVGERQVSRYERGQTVVPEHRLASVGTATGVPRWFFSSGFEAQPEAEEPTVAERVEALERQMATLLRRSGADAPAPPPTELLQPPGETEPKRSSGPDADSDQDTDAQRGSG